MAQVIFHHEIAKIQPRDEVLTVIVRPTLFVCDDCYISRSLPATIEEGGPP